MTITQAIDQPITSPVDSSIVGAGGAPGTTYAGRFDGVGYATAGDQHDVVGTAITIRFRARNFALTDNDYFVGKLPGSGATGYMVVTRVGGYRFGLGLTTGFTTLTPLGQTAPASDVEQSFAFRYNGTLMEWFLDGVKQPENQAATAAIASATGVNFNIGAGGTGGNQLAATMRDLRIDKRVLTDQQIADWHAFTADVTGDVCDYPINESTGSVLNDRTSAVNANLVGITPETFWVPIS